MEFYKMFKQPQEIREKKTKKQNKTKKKHIENNK